MICFQGSCVAECFFADAGPVDAGTPFPPNACLACQPVLSTNAWTTTPPGFTQTCPAGVVSDPCVDDRNCGTCGNACNPGSGCFAGTCTTPAPLPSAMARLAATTGPDGLVYALGGSVDATPKSTPLSTVVAFNPRTNQWDAGPSLPTAVMFMGAASTDAGIYVLGGAVCATGTGGSSPCTTELESFGQYLDVPSGVWSKTSSVATTLAFTGAATIPGPVLVVPGGGNSTGPLVQTETFTPSAGANGNWGNLPTLTYPAAHSGATAGLDGTVYVLGGLSTSDGGPDPRGIQSLALGAAQWTLPVALPTPSCDPVAATDQAGLIYALGGDNCDYGPNVQNINTFEVFNPDAGSWSSGSAPPTAAAFAGGATGVDGRIYVLGGVPVCKAGTAQTLVQVYNPATGQWVSSP